MFIRFFLHLIWFDFFSVVLCFCFLSLFILLSAQVVALSVCVCIIGCINTLYPAQNVYAFYLFVTFLCAAFSMHRFWQSHKTGFNFCVLFFICWVRIILTKLKIPNDWMSKWNGINRTQYLCRSAHKHIHIQKEQKSSITAGYMKQCVRLRAHAMRRAKCIA